MNKAASINLLGKRPVIVVEDDPFTRLISVALDPDCCEDRRAAFSDFMAHDEPNFSGWIDRLRQQVASIFPSEVHLVTSEQEMRSSLVDCHALVVESFRVTEEDLACARQLAVIQKFGATLRNIDVAACRDRGVRVVTLRRLANIACAEHAFALLLGLARRLNQLDGLVTKEQLRANGHVFRPFDRRHTPGGNFGRFDRLKSLHGSTIGIIGLGEIGREIALRAHAFEMRVLYHQRTAVADAADFNASYVPLRQLLAESDWIIPQIPGTASTFGIIGRDELAAIKPGASIVNISDPRLVDRRALLDALAVGRLGGFALDPLYSEPMKEGDELLSFSNVILSPHLAGSPRQNALKDFEQLIITLARELTP
jgi:phosphoglycerate dehydrogenase-like enzyme